MSGLSCFINGDLARDLANDIMSLVNKTKKFFFCNILIRKFSFYR
jgi:hypothetical protein